jgi:hypothetical protein
MIISILYQVPMFCAGRNVILVLYFILVAVSEGLAFSGATTLVGGDKPSYIMHMNVQNVSSGKRKQMICKRF